MRAKPKKVNPNGVTQARSPHTAFSTNECANDDDDEYDRSAILAATSTTNERATTGSDPTRVKMLWSDAKRDLSDAASPHTRCSNSCSRNNGSRARPPTIVHTPLRIQTRPAAAAASASLIALPRAPVATTSPREVIAVAEQPAPEPPAYEPSVLTPLPPSLLALITDRKSNGTTSAAFRDACTDIIELYPQHAAALSIDKRLWTDWYKEIGRRQTELRTAAAAAKTTTAHSSSTSDGSSTKSATHRLEDVLTRCAAFYARLVQALDVIYRSQLQVFCTSSSSATNDDAAATVSLVQTHEVTRQSLHTSRIALGDVARYMQALQPQAQSLQSMMCDAQQHYELAQRVLPTSGKAYNQLALLAGHRKHTLDAVYLYARSLACASPFPTRSNFVTALKRTQTTTAASTTQNDTLGALQLQVETLFVSCVRALYATTSNASARSSISDFHARANRLLGALACYVTTCSTQLLASESVALSSVCTSLRQIVRVLIFLVHDLQTPTSSSSNKTTTPLKSTDSDIAGATRVPNVQRTLSLAFSVVGSVMRECTKAVAEPAYMCVARELLNTLLPPISEFIAWLCLHPSLVTSLVGAGSDDKHVAALAGDAQRFCSDAVAFIAAVATSLLADRILDEDTAVMQARVLPEDRELEGFLPLADGQSGRHVTVATVASTIMSSTYALEAVGAIASVDNDSDDVLLDTRMWRILSFHDAVAQLSNVFTGTDTSISATTATHDRPGRDVEDSASTTTLETIAPAPRTPAARSTNTSAAMRSPALHAKPRRKPSPAHRATTTPPTSPPPLATDDHDDNDELDSDTVHNDAPLAFAAVMALDAAKLLYDASTATTSATDAAKCLIVIDAPNVAMRHGRGKRFSCAGIQLAIDYYVKRGHRVVGFLPDYLLDAAQVDERRRAALAGDDVPAAKIPDDVALLQRLVEQGLLVPTPGHDYDDSYCIQYAGMYDGCVVTNDQFRDHVTGMSGSRERKAAMRNWLTAHRVSYTWVRNEFLPNPDFRYPKPARL